MNYPNRPTHPDFWIMSRAVNEMDHDIEGGDSVDSVVAEIVDPECALYVGEQRALRATGAMVGPVPEPVMSVIVSAWLDGFMAGAKFQKSKS